MDSGNNDNVPFEKNMRKKYVLQGYMDLKDQTILVISFKLITIRLLHKSLILMK